MLKITINGEVFEWDNTRGPLHEAILIEETLKVSYAQWQADLQSKDTSARALAGLVLLVWRRAGREVTWADITSGKAEVNELDFENAEADEPVDPTAPVPAPGGTPTTGTATSGSSPSGSVSARGKSGSST